MRLLLCRDRLTPKATVGKLTHKGEFVAYTCEDRYRGDDMSEKVPGETCIPCGDYEVIVTYSPRFQVDMPLLLNVPGFTGVRIHSGNKPADTSGCILVGTTRGPDQVLGSRAAYEEVFKLIQTARAHAESVRLTVTLINGGTCNAEST